MILVVGVDLRLSGKDDVTVLGKAVYFVFTAADKVQFDAWQFSAEQTTGIQQVVPSPSSDSKLYDLSGRRINNNASKGIVIEQSTDVNGKKQSRKILR